jgi:hypothetical protein
MLPDRAWSLAAIVSAASKVRQLQRRRRHVALADADADGIAREPHLRFLAAEGVLLPLSRGQDAGLFAGNVDARGRAETELLQIVVDVVDAHLVRQIVEVDVA